MNNESDNKQQVAIIRQENIAAIVQAAPQSYLDNRQSNRRCLQACRELLDTIEAEGMTDRLDQQAAAYIEKARRTVKVMNERRSPVTKLFDQIRAEFTSLENAIDPSRSDTVPYRLQQLRNRYAARKREEQEAIRRAEEAKRLAEQARQTYRQALSEDFHVSFNRLVNKAINELTSLRASVTLDTYQSVLDTVTGYSADLPSEWKPEPSVANPSCIAPDESSAIRSEVFESLLPGFRERYKAEIADLRSDILDKLPSKRAELQRAEAASAAEAERIKAEIAAHEAAEAERKEQERKQKEEAERRKAEAEKAQTQMAGLFNAAQAEAYTPKAKVTKKIHITAPEAVLAVITLWWQREGCRLTVEELQKNFRKQITFCERLANKEGELIKADGLEYIDEVKAK